MEIYRKNVEAFTRKLENRWRKTILLSVLGGFFIGLGAIGYMYALAYLGVAGKIVGASLFPIGLLLCVFMGGSIFTSDCLVALPGLEKKGKWSRIAAHWMVVIVFNFVGTIIIAIITYWAKIYSSGVMNNALAKLIVAKSDVEWYATIGSGILCNLLVAGALFMSNGTDNEFAKIFMVWFAVAIFAFGGFQHVVANLYFYSASWLQFGDTVVLNGIAHHITFNGWFQNLIPAFIGNWIAGAVMIPAAYYFLNKWTK